MELHNRLREWASSNLLIDKLLDGISVLNERIELTTVKWIYLSLLERQSVNAIRFARWAENTLASDIENLRPLLTPVNQAADKPASKIFPSYEETFAALKRHCETLRSFLAQGVVEEPSVVHITLILNIDPIFFGDLVVSWLLDEEIGRLIHASYQVHEDRLIAVPFYIWDAAVRSGRVEILSEENITFWIEEKQQNTVHGYYGDVWDYIDLNTEQRLIEAMEKLQEDDMILEVELRRRSREDTLLDVLENLNQQHWAELDHILGGSFRLIEPKELLERLNKHSLPSQFIDHIIYRLISSAKRTGYSKWANELQLLMKSA